jgi:site-specific DNA recombinase
MALPDPRHLPPSGGAAIVAQSHLNKFFIYARKSTESEDRQVRSIADQLAEVRELATREHLDIVDTLIEKQTAKVPGRPVFNQMLERIERGEANGILAWHPDRLARNSVDGGRIIWLVDTQKIRHLRFPTFWFEPTAQGKFMLSMMLSQSKYYVDNLSENIRRGQRQKLRKGIWPMVAPIGYCNDPKTHTIVPDPVRAPLIRQAFELYATGSYNLRQMETALANLGLTTRYGKSVGRAQIHRLLQKPFYYGVLLFAGEYHEAAHPAIITKQLFQTVQDVLKSKGRRQSPGLKPYLYRGMFRCGECGCFITTETHKGANYLRCTKKKGPCSQAYVREESVTMQVAKAVRSASMHPDAADWMIQQFEAERSQDNTSIEADRQAVRDRMGRIDEKIALLVTAYVDGTVTLPELGQAKVQFLNEKQELKQQLAEMDEQHLLWFEQAIRFIQASKQAYFLGRGDETFEQGDFLKKIGSNLTIRDKHVTWQPVGPWKLVVNKRFLARDDTAAPLTGAAEPVNNPSLSRLRSGFDRVRAIFKDISGRHLTMAIV